MVMIILFMYVSRILTKNDAGQFEEGDSIELKFTEKKGYEMITF